MISSSNVVFFTLVFTIVIFVATRQTTQCNAAPPDGNNKTDENRFDCKKVMGRIMKKMIKVFGACTKEVKANSTKEDFEKKMACIVKCVMGKVGIMDIKGNVTKETIQGFMTSMDVPQDAHDLGHLLSEGCINDHSAKLDPSQAFCESYGEFTLCMQTVFGDFAEKNDCQPGGLG